MKSRCCLKNESDNKAIKAKHLMNELQCNEFQCNEM